ncbi:nitroreductase family deazaflavin-dependent oxidoreductase [Litorivivens sp.]|uniref:nitroreductase family deazaflavin-dependent oxidoreductase n=1 Tax=Litorivivens sp. TaxID=2020868 RepID=UPI003569BBDD
MVEYDYVKTKRADVKPIPQEHFGAIKKVMKWVTAANVWVFKKSKGRLWKNFPGGYPICVVGMKGAKTGAWREIALIHLPEGDNVYLVASQGGMDRHPVWYHNIAANPDITVMFGGNTRNMRARQISDEEKAAAWPHLCSLYPDFDEYQARTDRNIPVFLCEPVK